MNENKFEEATENNTQISSKRYIIGISVVAALLLYPACFIWGQHSAIDKTALKTVYEEKVAIDDEYNTKKSQLSDIEKEYNEKKTAVDAAKAYESTKQEKDNELSGLINQIEEKKLDLESITSRISTKTSELNQLTNAITTAKSERVLSAGRYTVGTDIESGKYDIQWCSGSGNFYTYGGGVNEIFSNQSYGIKEYKNMTVKSGDEIEVSGSLKVKLLLK